MKGLFIISAVITISFTSLRVKGAIHTHYATTQPCVSLQGVSLQGLTPPHFPGGERVFNTYLGKNLKWPASDSDFKGKVVVSFFVEKNGKLTDIKVIKSAGPAYDAEALRVIRNSPKWVPAMKNHQPIKSKYSVPISFTVSQ